jgi:hypothetical protein
MKGLIQKTIALLKMQVKSNLEVINQNQTKIKEILQEPASAERSYNFERHYEVNKTLLAENNDLINVQLTLINFMEKYKNSNILEEKNTVIDFHNVDEDELFKLTVNGTVSFEKGHPFFEDEEFFVKLMKHYQEKEEYERCQELLNVKKF